MKEKPSRLTSSDYENLERSYISREIADQAGISDVLISISHCRSFATATAIAVGR